MKNIFRPSKFCIGTPKCDNLLDWLSGKIKVLFWRLESGASILSNLEKTYGRNIENILNYEMSNRHGVPDVERYHHSLPQGKSYWVSFVINLEKNARLVWIITQYCLRNWKIPRGRNQILHFQPTSNGSQSHVNYVLFIVSNFESNWPRYNHIVLYCLLTFAPMFTVPPWHASVTDAVSLSIRLAVLITRLAVLAVGSMWWYRLCALLDRVAWYVGTAIDPWALVAFGMVVNDMVTIGRLTSLYYGHQNICSHDNDVNQAAHIMQKYHRLMLLVSFYAYPRFPFSDNYSRQ